MVLFRTLPLFCFYEQNKKERKKVKEVWIFKKDPNQLKKQIDNLEMMSKSCFILYWKAVKSDIIYFAYHYYYYGKMFIDCLTVYRLFDQASNSCCGLNESLILCNCENQFAKSIIKF